MKDKVTLVTGHMDIYEAIRILNKECHRGYEYWSSDNDGFVRGAESDECFDEFEAIAIAEAYERIPDVPHDPRTKLPSSKVIDAIRRCEERLHRNKNGVNEKD